MLFKQTQKNVFSYKQNSKKIEVIASEKLFKKIDSLALNQLVSISDINQVYDKVIGLPDIHVGYGVPIGSCFATEYSNGIISPEAVGYDINCGVRLIKTDLHKKDISEKGLHNLAKSLLKLPLGLSNQGITLSKKDFTDILLSGSKWAFEKNYCSKKDISKIDDFGCYKNASIEYLSKQTIERGIKQIGTLGKGNHFIDILLVKDIFSEKDSNYLGLQKDYYCIMLHSGSRGFGHQIAKDFSQISKYKKPFSYDLFNSDNGQAYYKSMLAAANFAFVNRIILTKLVEDKIKEIKKDISFDLLYDLCHNIAKIEKHKSKKLIVHRKGATKVYTKEESKTYPKTGNPVILPGSMQHDSFVLLPKSIKQLEKTYFSVAHGSGRQLSRQKAKQKTNIKDLRKKMNKQKIMVFGNSEQTILEEQPNAYKPSSEVVNSLVDLNLLKKTISLKPKIVITG
jgi:tRNA-splicing ligase RtcB (3'-phosphate/5'-hydroxy nucleic acid ligase)